MLTSRTAWTPPKATLIPRSSTSGVRSATVTILPSRGSRAAPTVDGVEPDGDDQDDPGHHVLPGGVHAHEREPVGERLHHEGPDDRPGDGADPSGERGPADDRGRDDVQLVGLADVERRAVQAS